MEESLSDKNILKALNFQANLILYEQIKDFLIDFFDLSGAIGEPLAMTIILEKILGSNGKAVILYQWKKNYGHWTALSAIGGQCRPCRLEYFDSYGKIPDKYLINTPTESSAVPPEYKKYLNEDYPYLMLLLYLANSILGCEVVYNEIPMQKMGEGIATCGKHVVSRLKFDNLTLEQYQDLMEKISKSEHLSPDEIVCELYKIWMPFS